MNSGLSSRFTVSNRTARRRAAAFADGVDPGAIASTYIRSLSRSARKSGRVVVPSTEGWIVTT
jgi:hypothetical protein